MSQALDIIVLKCKIISKIPNLIYLCQSCTVIYFIAKMSVLLWVFSWISTNGGDGKLKAWKQKNNWIKKCLLRDFPRYLLLISYTLRLILCQKLFSINWCSNNIYKIIKDWQIKKRLKMFWNFELLDTLNCSFHIYLNIYNINCSMEIYFNHLVTLSRTRVYA